MASGPLQAHHALGGVYDLKNQETVSGTVVRILLANPHGTLWVSVRNADGATSEWAFTTDSAATLAARGIGTNSNVLKAGDQISATFFAARAQKAASPLLGYLKSLTTAGGTTLELPANPFTPLVPGGTGDAARPPTAGDRR
jgi:hypothetical protein